MVRPLKFFFSPPPTILTSTSSFLYQQPPTLLLSLLHLLLTSSTYNLTRYLPSPYIHPLSSSASSTYCLLLPHTSLLSVFLLPTSIHSPPQSPPPSVSSSTYIFTQYPPTLLCLLHLLLTSSTNHSLLLGISFHPSTHINPSCHFLPLLAQQPLTLTGVHFLHPSIHSLITST
ncbi:hypothetical protein Pcinc_042599 [Petrolisthes cinctipes]|uniref:Uncharacterized protein n=1 Tax=Petrolisthes cinctipes TaxID=88211 RepID=A0AAE1BHE1_PETCI|nr:hypothetical protein Pcinc_042599 [Petrolisthes cinctipes]